MKKNSTCFHKWLLVFIVISCNHFAGIAQTGNNNSTKKNNGSAIAISISGVEYDDANFITLKESIKKNAKCSDIKQSYAQNTARISLNYSGEATDLWDELPASTRQPFKITSMESNRIELKLKNAVTTTAESSKNNTATTTAKTDDDCKNCYFNLCKYDGLKTFQGVVYKQINKNDGTYYYNCDNGILVEKRVFQNQYGVITNITTDTILNSNLPIGATWKAEGDEDEEFMFLGVMSKSFSRWAMVGKDVTITVNGKVYTDVIVTNFKVDSKGPMGEGYGSSNHYYAKGAGLIKTEEVDPKTDPFAALNKNPNPKKTASGSSDTKPDNQKNPTVNTSFIKGSIDSTLVGTWKYEKGQTVAYWKLNADGTYDYYTGSITPANRNKGKCYWGFDSKILVTNCEGDRNQNRYDFQKKNDAITGKPAILINGYTYLSIDNKTPW